MSEWVEFRVDVMCPHCDAEYDEHVEFNFGEADQHGCMSPIKQFICDYCDKPFWQNHYLEFNIDIWHTEKKKPKGK